jgi:hypothetical protein
MEAFDAVASVSNLRDKAYNRRLIVEPTLARANQAWRAHDYGTVVDLLAGMADSLGAADKLRLRLAAKYLEQQ